jgi:hypothetical protein
MEEGTLQAKFFIDKSWGALKSGMPIPVGTSFYQPFKIM